MKNQIFRIAKEDEEHFESSFTQGKNGTFRILFNMYRGNYGRLFLSTLFFIIKHSPAWVLPIVTSEVINIVSDHRGNGVQRIWMYLAFMAVLIVQNVFTNYLHVKFKSQAIRYVEAGLRGSMVRKLQQLSISYHKQMQSGRLQSKIMRDVEAVENLSTQLFINMLNISISMVVALSVTLSKSWVVFCFFLLSVPVASLTIVAFRSKIRGTNAEFRRGMEETSAKMMEMMELVPVTRAHALEEKEIHRMEQQLSMVAEKGYRLDIVQALFGATSWMIFQIFQLICLGFTSYLAFQGKISVGEIVMYQTYFTTIINQVTSIINLIPILAKGFESLHSIAEVMDAEDVESYNGKEKIKKVEGNFRFDHIVYHYPDSDEPVLNGFSLDVKAGETIAFVGESGAGKTTLLNLVIGFMKPDDGTIYLDGEDMKNMDLRSYRRHLAVVPQNTILFSGSIRDNITYGMPNVSESKMEEVLKASNLWDVIQKLPEGLDTKIGEHGDKLSGGQRQRVSIARALMRNPDVIILDEATSALDSVSERKIQEAFDRLSEGKTTFIVAHRLSTVKRADRIVVVGDGGLKEAGTYDELMAKKGAFYQYWEMQH